MQPQPLEVRFSDIEVQSDAIRGTGLTQVSNAPVLD